MLKGPVVSTPERHLPRRNRFGCFRQYGPYNRTAAECDESGPSVQTGLM